MAPGRARIAACRAFPVVAPVRRDRRPSDRLVGGELAVSGRKLGIIEFAFGLEVS
jgi:hypothetical protein